jgi:hypothetical protein
MFVGNMLDSTHDCELFCIRSSLLLWGNLRLKKDNGGRFRPVIEPTNRNLAYGP